MGSICYANMTVGNEFAIILPSSLLPSEVVDDRESHRGSLGSRTGLLVLRGILRQADGIFPPTFLLDQVIASVNTNRFRLPQGRPRGTCLAGYSHGYCIFSALDRFLSVFWRINGVIGWLVQVRHRFLGQGVICVDFRSAFAVCLALTGLVTF